ncbi:hypothetical protein EOM82_06330 [bacterium]|nr:hypothetical protein [bacterium]
MPSLFTIFIKLIILIYLCLGQSVSVDILTYNIYAYSNTLRPMASSNADTLQDSKSCEARLLRLRDKAEQAHQKDIAKRAEQLLNEYRYLMTQLNSDSPHGVNTRICLKSANKMFEIGMLLHSIGDLNTASACCDLAIKFARSEDRESIPIRDLLSAQDLKKQIGQEVEKLQNSFNESKIPADSLLSICKAVCTAA